MDLRFSRLFELEKQWHRDRRDQSDPLPEGLIFRFLQAEYVRMTGHERVQLIRCHERLRDRMGDLDIPMRTVEASHSVVMDGNHLTRRDPDIKILETYKADIEEIVDCAKAAREEAEQINYIRQKHHAVQAMLVWVHEIIQGTKNLEDYYAPKWKVVDESILRYKFMQEPLDPEQFAGQWTGVLDLGGGISRAGLWVRHNQHGDIIDRVVRKNEYMDDDHWLRPSKWHGDPADFNNRVPLEFFLQDKCSKVSDSHFARMRTWAQDLEHRVLSLYVEYCSFGDLRGIQRKCPQQYFPEGAMWMIFKHLVECCLIMRQGGIRTPVTGWQEIVHRDIKPHNIFMDNPAEVYFPRYPTPKMADFGLAIQTSKRDPKNPQDYQGAGTTGWKAPEQTRLRSDWKLLDHTNVYAIGVVMYSLLRGYMYIVREPDFVNARTKLKITDEVDKYYSAPLVDLIMSCVEWNPSHRKDLGELWHEIDNFIDNEEYMSNAADGKQDPDALPDLAYGPDQYRIALASSPEDLDRSEEQAAGASGPHDPAATDDDWLADTSMPDAEC